MAIHHYIGGLIDNALDSVVRTLATVSVLHTEVSKFVHAPLGKEYRPYLCQQVVELLYPINCTETSGLALWVHKHVVPDRAPGAIQSKSVLNSEFIEKIHTYRSRSG